MAVSLAAKTFGVPAHIVMPKSSPHVKQESVRGYGGNITLCDQPTEEVGLCIPLLCDSEQVHLRQMWYVLVVCSFQTGGETERGRGLEFVY